MLENMRNIALGLGIAIILPLTTHYGIIAFGASKLTHFFIALAIGSLSVIVGVASRLGFLGFGAILGGVFCVIEGYAQYWPELSDITRFVSLLVFLCLMICASYVSVRLRK